MRCFGDVSEKTSTSMWPLCPRGIGATRAIRTIRTTRATRAARAIGATRAIRATRIAMAIRATRATRATRTMRATGLGWSIYNGWLQIEDFRTVKVISGWMGSTSDHYYH